MIVVIVRQQQDVDLRQVGGGRAAPARRFGPNQAKGEARSVRYGSVSKVRPPRRIRKQAWPSQVTLSRPSAAASPASAAWRAGRARQARSAPAAGRPAGATGTSATPPRCRRARGCRADCGRCRRADDAKEAYRDPVSRRVSAVGRASGRPTRQHRAPGQGACARHRHEAVVVHMVVRANWLGRHACQCLETVMRLG